MWNNITNFINNKEGNCIMKKSLKNLFTLLWIFISSICFTIFMRPRRRVFEVAATKIGSNSKIIIYFILFLLFFCICAYIAHLAYHTDFCKKTKVSTAIYFFLLSLTLVGCFKDNVNSIIIYRLLPKVEVEVSVTEITDINIGTGNLRNRLAPDNITTAEKHNDGLFIKVFNMTVVPESYIKVGVNNEISEIDYTYKNKQFVYTVTPEDKTNAYAKIYPFADSTRKVFLSLVIYLFLAVLVMTWLLCLHIYITTRETIPRLFEIRYTKKYIFFFIIFICCFSISLFQYVNKFHLPYYMPDNAIGDQSDYWAWYIFKDGKINTDIRIVSFRGYTNYLFSSVSKVLGARLSIDPVKVYLIFPAFCFAWLLSIIIPGLYSALTKKESKLFSVIMFSGLFVYYWAEFLTLLLTDFYNNVLLFAGIFYSIQAYRKQSLFYSAIAGLTISLMINMHYSYGIYLIVIIIGYVICLFIKKSRNNKTLLDFKAFIPMLKNKIKPVISKKRIIGMSLAVTCFLLVCAPQAMINYNSNYIGLFPHDSEKAYCDRPVSWSMWNTFLAGGMILWPKFLGDGQTNTMKTQLYEQRFEWLHPTQCMDVYAESPVETAVTLIKKCFVMFDKKDHVNYGIAITWRETFGLVFSFFNYLILLTGLYTLIKWKKQSFPCQCLSWLIFFSSVCMNLVGHVEQRLSMTFYIILLMYFAYSFVGEIAVDKNEYKEMNKENGLIKFIVFGELLCFTLSMALWGN